MIPNFFTSLFTFRHRLDQAMLSKQTMQQSSRLLTKNKALFSTTPIGSNVAGGLRKPSVPFRDYDAVKRNALGAVSREDVALDSFFSRHRPIFLMDLKGQQQRTGANMSPWFQTASGVELNPDMQYVLEDVVDRLKPFEEQKPIDIEQEEMEHEELMADSTVSSLAAQLEKALNLKIKDMEVLMPNGSKGSFILVNKPSTNSTTDMEATSVMRKRRIKMNRHKYKKRRKAQRAMRRKLNK